MMKTRTYLSAMSVLAVVAAACGSNPKVGKEGTSGSGEGGESSSGSGESSIDTDSSGDSSKTTTGGDTESGTSGDSGGSGDSGEGGAFSAPDWDFPDDVDFDYTPIKTGGQACASVEGTPSSVSRPIDIIFIIDNSSSMKDEIQEVETNVKSNFADIIEASEVDYRVIMVSRYGSSSGPDVGGSDFQVCIPEPLGGHDCSTTADKLPQNTERFFHYSADIESLDALCVLLESYDEPDEFDNADTSLHGGNGSVYRSWMSRAPNGWQQWLRPDAFKTFVMITDDDIDCNTNKFGAFVADQNFTNLTLDDGPNDASAGKDVADAFDAALLSLSSEQFGTAESRNYIWHSIVGLNENDPIAEPWFSSEDVVEGNCSPGSSGNGTGYQQLSRLTGGLRYPICVVDGGGDFNPIFDEIAQGVIETADVPCEYDFPDVDGLINPDNIKVNYQPSGGGDVVEFNRVTDDSECTSGDDFYFDDNQAPTQLFLCGGACTTVQDDGGEVKLDFGCLGS